jgi:hypothetical protein
MLPTSTFSATSVATVHKWIENCTSNHVNCGSSGPQQLPTRVIDVGQRQCSDIKLYEPGGKIGSYVCLSHCWGPRGLGILTTTKTIEEYKLNIPWILLPATFREAVTVVRLLGLKYLWIDSLCIVQDSEEDWRRESGTMSSVFQNAFITLAATHATSANCGLFSKQSISSRARAFKSYDCNGIPSSFFIRTLPPHDFDWLDATLPGYEESFPLFRRAWVFQERLLSSSILNFQKEELIWECSEHSQCQCLYSLEPYNFGPKVEYTKAMTQGSQADLAGCWRSIVYAYTMLQLSFAKDKLPALSGIAKSMQ